VLIGKNRYQFKRHRHKNGYNSQISRFSNREDIRAFIEEEQKRLVEVAPDAIENLKELVREMKRIAKKDVRRWELSYQASLPEVCWNHVESSSVPGYYQHLPTE
jgi:hypothetical protein